LSPGLAHPEVSLADRYTAESGEVQMSGIQALVRLMLDQRRLDTERGFDTRIFVSGYQGSPLGGLDNELRRAAEHLEPAGVVFQAGLNEELAATSVAGTQLLGQLAGRRHDGVTGFWYGKNPGFDRAADAIRHGNLSGTAPLGGAVALIGDDPSAKSSTVPSSCEPMCRSLMVPVLAPSSVQELLTFGLHAVALSRHSGSWAGMKIVADIADAGSTVDVGTPRALIPALAPRDSFEPPVLLPPSNLEAEHDLMSGRLDRAREYARLAGLNRVAFEPARPRTAIVAAGIAWSAVVRALADLGLGEAEMDALGLRLVQIGMPWPLERDEVRRLTAGAETVLVVEDKIAFLESQVKEALYRTPGAPLVVGQCDAEGRPLVPVRSSTGADDVARALARVLDHADLPERAREHLAVLERSGRAAPPDGAVLPKRTPYFCSGCPHNTSTRAEPDDLVGVGIGCHTMVALDDGGRRGQLVGMPQMGGEGAQWIGLAPFTDDPHFIQNLGDGTFHHSGSLAIRAAVAAGVNVTYRLLYNDAVAMTGGQQPEGKMDVPSLTRWLELEGVKRVVVTTPEPDRYRGVELAGIAEVRHRDVLQEASRELAATPGVTVLIHDDQCATEKRRLRKRGKLPKPTERVWINQRVCEGCGDCGEKSSCLSVQPVATEFGRKTEIHQASCNSDLTCLKGDCPSFVMVTPREGEKAELRRPSLPVELTAPAPLVGPDVLLRMPGVGGTGVVTVSAILQMAAHLDGLHASGLEQTGLAQKGGPVLSDVRIARDPVEGLLRAGAGSVDVMIGFDLLGAAAPDTLAVADPERTVAVLNTAQTPTARMVTDPAQGFADTGLALRRVERVTRTEHNVYLDATGLSQRLFGDHMPANMLLVGAAYQRGCLPVGAEAIERAIELNGAAVEANIDAFRWGRAAVIAPDAVAAALADEPPAGPDPRALAMLADVPVGGELRRLLEIRLGELIAYQDERYAERYLADVLSVARVEHEQTGGGTAVAEAYARGLFKLMAYKDEYEVARLHLESAEQARRDAEFGGGARVKILLHPPLLRAMGLKRKIGFGACSFPFLRALYRARRVRGTALDPFGRAHVRRVERALVGEYRGLVEASLEHLTPATAGQVEAIAELPDVVRGYEDIKLASVDAFRLQAKAMSDNLAATAARQNGRSHGLSVVQAGGLARSVPPRRSTTSGADV
jgi:indolepyruvate ferredoxin oxidoreductase